MDAAFGDKGDLVMQMGMQYGQKFLKEGESGIFKYLPISDLRRYFRVSNDYVKNKLAIVAFPFLKDFTRQNTFGALGVDDSAQQSPNVASPMDDVNTTDLYIPMMALITYVTLCGFAKGLRDDTLSPQYLATTFTTAIVLHIIEVICIKLVRYVIGLPPMFNTLDLISLCGYKYCGVCIVLLLKEFSVTGWLAWAVTAYFAGAMAFFMFKSIREIASGGDGRVPKRAVFVAYGAAAFQVPMMFFYCRV